MKRPTAGLYQLSWSDARWKNPLDSTHDALSTARQIVIERLRRDASWDHLDRSGEGFSPFVEYVAPNEPARQNARSLLVFLAQEVFWQLLIEGIVAPGMNSSNLDLPRFHITEHGRKVLASSEPQPYDPTGYLARLRERVPSPDPTVSAYLAESQETFRKANLVASTVMLGIAAERVFLLLCDSLAAALSSTSEKAAFAKLLDRFPMKPKLDRVQNKIQQIQKQAPARLPGECHHHAGCDLRPDAHAAQRTGPPGRSPAQRSPARRLRQPANLPRLLRNSRAGAGLPRLKSRVRPHH